MERHPHPFWRTILTEDNADEVWCLVRLLILIVFVVVIGLAIFMVLTGQPFDLPAFVQAVAVLITAAGAAIFLNGRSEAQ